jgi:HlyD family secretion protein
VTARDTSQKILREVSGDIEQAQTDESTTETRDNLKEYVFIERDGKAMLTTVTTGIQDRNYIQIMEGVSNGDKIIVAPYSAISRNLKHEDAVEVVAKDKLFAKSD